MASPAEQILNDGASDYGSEFSPEEEQMIAERLSFLEDDNPIVNEIEYHDPQRTLRLPPVRGREELFPLFHAARAAERVAEQIAKSTAVREQYPDCKLLSFRSYLLI